MSAEQRRLLQTGAERLGLSLPAADWERLELFLRLLAAANQRLNLTRITDQLEVARLHVLDAWTCCLFIGESGRLVDVGAGAGIPGIPLKLARPDLELTLVEASRKKTEFLQSVCAELRLTGVEVIWGRAEELGRQPQYREHFEYATSRALGALPLVSELCMPLLRIGGRLVAQRGRDGEGEAAVARSAAAVLGGAVTAVRPVREFTGRDHYLVVLEKTAATPLRFPRAWGTIQKKPLWEDPGTRSRT